MKWKKTLAILTAAAFCVGGLSGCKAEEAVLPPSSERAAPSSAAQEPSSEGDESSAAPAQAQYPVTIQNYNYAKEPVEFTYEKAPEKVVCIWTNSVENMLALGLGDRIALAAGVTREEILPEYQEEAAKVQEYQGKYPPKEDIVALQPDFILGWRSSFAEEKYWGDVTFWNERSIGTYISLNSGLMKDQTLQNEYDDLLTLGRIFGVEDRAEALVAGMQAKVEKGRAYAEGKDPVQLLILENEGDVFRNYGANSIGGSIAEQVGAEILEPDQSKRLGAEDLVSLNPRIIFAVYFGDEIGRDECVKDFTENPAYASIDAVKNGKVYPIDLSLIYCPGVRVGNAIDFFLTYLYPDMQ